MEIRHDNNYVIRFGNGDLWHFTSEKNKGISFRCQKEDGNWDGFVDLIEDVQEDFSLSMDEKNNLHMVCYSAKGEIYYLKYNGRTWSKQIVSRFEPARYTIRFPAILVLEEKIHILLAIGTTFNIGLWSILHYCWNGESWSSKEVAKFTAGKKLSPFRLDHHGGDIHLVYRGLTIDKFQIHYCSFLEEQKQWTSPQNISRSIYNCNTPSILIKDNILHLVWTSARESSMQVKYRGKMLGAQGKFNWGPEKALSNSEASSCFPQLLWVYNQLWCIWYQKDDLHGCCSPNQGDDWELSKPLDWPNLQNLYYLQYLSNEPEEKKNFKIGKIFAVLEGGIKIPIVNKVPHSLVHETTPPEVENESQEALPKEEIEMAKESQESSFSSHKEILPYLEELKSEISEISKMKEELKSILQSPQRQDTAIDEIDAKGLDENLKRWIEEASEINKKNQIMLIELETLREHVLENQRQWNLLLIEFEEIKKRVNQLQEVGFFKRIFKGNKK